MLDKNLVQDVLSAALETGGDLAEVFVENSNSLAIKCGAGKIQEIDEGIVYGVGIRLLRNLQSVYGYTNDVSRAGLMTLAETLSKSFDGERIKTVSELETKKVEKKACAENRGVYVQIPIYTMVGYPRG